MQNAGDGFDEIVAGGVANGVVDDFEVVEIHEKKGARCAGAGFFDRIGKNIVKGVAVGKAGEQIVIGKKIEAVFTLFLFGGVAKNKNGLGLAVSEIVGFAGGFDPKKNAVFVTVAKSEANGILV